MYLRRPSMLFICAPWMYIYIYKLHVFSIDLHRLILDAFALKSFIRYQEDWSYTHCQTKKNIFQVFKCYIHVRSYTREVEGMLTCIIISGHQHLRSYTREVEGMLTCIIISGYQHHDFQVNFNIYPSPFGQRLHLNMFLQINCY